MTMIRAIRAREAAGLLARPEHMEAGMMAAFEVQEKA
jgi:hypothetical protein